MIYIVLYSNRWTRGIFYAASLKENEARDKYTQIPIEGDIPRKELWLDDGNGYRRLLDSENYGGEANG